MYQYFTGEQVYGDYVYIPEEHMDERWWFINGFQGYMVSDHGRVWSEKTQHFLKLKKMDRHGHLGVCLHQNGKMYYKYIHRLVAEAFIPNPDNKPCVCHVMDNPDYNEWYELKWGTVKENHEDCVKNGHYRPFSSEDREKSYEKNRIPIYAIRLSDGYKKWHRSLTDAARDLGLQQANAWKVLNNQRPHTRGWRFEVANNE